MVTATFYRQVSKSEDDALRYSFKYPNMQVVLLSVSCMYFVLGSTLEYMRRTDIFIACIAAIYGTLKLSVNKIL
jgi:hypothetical protein